MMVDTTRDRIEALLRAAVEGNEDAVLQAAAGIRGSHAVAPKLLTLLESAAARMRRDGCATAAVAVLEVIERCAEDDRRRRHVRAEQAAVREEIARAEASRKRSALIRAAAGTRDAELANRMALKWRPKEPSVAAAYARRAAELAPTAHNLVMLGACLRDAGDLPAAEAAHKHALAKKSRSAAARLGLAAVLHDLDDGRLAHAERLANEALAIIPNDPGAFRTLAAIYSKQGRSDEAKRAYQRAYRSEK